VVIEDGRATGVRYAWRDETVSARARREVIVCGGALASPKLLMLSGVGPADQLREAGVEVKVNAPGVGANLQEHPCIMISRGAKVPTLNTEMVWWKALGHGLNYLLTGGGPASTPVGHAQVFFRTRDTQALPSIQAILVPCAYQMETLQEGLRLHPTAAMSLAVCLLHPRQRGEVRLQSSDPQAPPRIIHQLLSNATDVAELIEGCKASMDILRAPPLDGLLTEMVAPKTAPANDEEWLAYLRASAFRGDHPIGTCRMGEDPEAVVDSQLRVNGIAGLRVVDASIMPTLPSGNTNAVVIMIAEKASAMILDAAGSAA
jgi:choline dehydrogenase